MVQVRKRQSDAGPGCCTGLEGPAAPRFFKALCDPNRLVLLARLCRCGEGFTVSQLAECCPTDVSVVSRHLATLRDAGILKAEKRGREVHYSVDCAALAATLRATADAIEVCCPPPSRTARKRTRRSRGTRPHADGRKHGGRRRRASP